MLVDPSKAAIVVRWRFLAELLLVSTMIGPCT